MTGTISVPFAFSITILPGEAYSNEGGLMTEAPSPDAVASPIPKDGGAGETTTELARVIQARTSQGYRIESASETRAVLVCKGRKRLFGLRHGEDHRTELTMGEHGRVVTRNI